MRTVLRFYRHTRADSPGSTSIKCTCANGDIKLRMNPVEQALWYVEAHLKSNITLTDVAASACVSKHHLLRAFSAATGVSVMRYARGRRLTEAALRLANGADDILDVAVEAGYSSHEAFTRAFGEQFGATPVEVRVQGHVRNLRLVQPIALDGAPLPIEGPRFEEIDTLLITGINRRYDGLESSAGVPGQWEQFGAEHALIAERLDTAITPSVLTRMDGVAATA